MFCKRWGSLWLEVSDFYYLSLVLTNHNYLSKILSRSSITRVPVEISFEVLNFVSLHIFASAIVLSLWRTLLVFFPLLCSLLLFSRSMRDKDTSALREMFQYSSLTEKPFDQWEVATHWRQDKSRHGEDWGRNPPKKCFCISLEGMVWLNDLFCWGQLMVSLQTVAHTFVRLSHQIITWWSVTLQDSGVLLKMVWLICPQKTPVLV